MSTHATPLTPAAIATAVPRSKEYELSAGDGLSLVVRPSGTKCWKFRYVFGLSRRRIHLGSWPAISLSDAQAAVADARERLALGIDPGLAPAKQADENAVTFEQLAWEWFGEAAMAWSPSYAALQEERLIRDVLGFLPEQGRLSIGCLTAPLLVRTLRAVLQKGAEVAKRARIIIEQVCRYAVNAGQLPQDPSVGLSRAIPYPEAVHHPIPSSVEELGAILRMLDGAADTHPAIRHAIRLIPYLGVRPGELRQMKWEEIDFRKAEWRHTALKTAAAHVVPLSRQALGILRQAQVFSGRTSIYCFPNHRTMARPMSDGALSAAYARIGISKSQLVPHSWRAILRTFGAQECGFRPEWLEAALAHTPADKLGNTYNRTDWLEQRRDMMQKWADWLDGVRRGEIESDDSIKNVFIY